MSLSIDYAQKLLTELLEHKSWLNDHQKIKIRQAITDLYCSHEMLSLLIDRPNDQEDFISEEAVSKFISSFSDEDVENEEAINNKIGMLLGFIKELIRPKVASDIVTKVRDLLSSENQKLYRGQKENFLARIGDIFKGLHVQIVKIPDPNVLNSFADSIIQGINAIGDWAQKKIFVVLCLKLTEILPDPKKIELANLIQAFFLNTNIDGIKFVFDKLSKEEKTQLLQEPQYVATFQQRVQQQDVFNFLYPLAPKEIKTQWLVSLINSAPQIALSKLKELSYKVDNKVVIVDALLKKVPQAPIQEKGSFYDAVNKMKCANDPNLRDILTTQIKNLLKNADPAQQEIGYNTLQNATYLLATAKRDIARETMERLRLLQPDGAGQPYSIKSLLLNWNILPKTPQRDFVDFIFDKLIKRGVNINNIKLGFEALSVIKPKYEDYSTYFDDVSNRVEVEENPQIKSELINGLLKLRTERTNRKNQDFWKKIDALSINQS